MEPEGESYEEPPQVRAAGPGGMAGVPAVTHLLALLPGGTVRGLWGQCPRLGLQPLLAVALVSCTPLPPCRKNIRSMNQRRKGPGRPPTSSTIPAPPQHPTSNSQG